MYTWILEKNEMHAHWMLRLSQTTFIGAWQIITSFRESAVLVAKVGTLPVFANEKLFFCFVLLFCSFVLSFFSPLSDKLAYLGVNNNFHVERTIFYDSLHRWHADPQVVGVENSGAKQLQLVFCKKSWNYKQCSTKNLPCQWCMAIGQRIWSIELCLLTGWLLLPSCTV